MQRMHGCTHACADASANRRAERSADEDSDGYTERGTDAASDVGTDGRNHISTDLRLRLLSDRSREVRSDEWHLLLQRHGVYCEAVRLRRRQGVRRRGVCGVHGGSDSSAVDVGTDFGGANERADAADGGADVLGALQ